MYKRKNYEDLVWPTHSDEVNEAQVQNLSSLKNSLLRRSFQYIPRRSKVERARGFLLHYAPA